MEGEELENVNAGKVRLPVTELSGIWTYRMTGEQTQAGKKRLRNKVSHCDNC